MQTRLKARNSDVRMSPERIVARLRGEFSYVESVEYPYDFQREPLHVYFGDDPSAESKIMSAAIMPGPQGSLVVSWSSDARAAAAEPLVRRSAAALGYEIEEEQPQHVRNPRPASYFPAMPMLTAAYA